MSLANDLRRITRRGFLGLGAAGALGHWMRRRPWLERPAGPITPQFIMSGGATPTGMLVHSMLSEEDKGAKANLAYWRADGTGTTHYAGVRAADGNAIVRHPVAKLKPDTDYVAQLVWAGQRVGEQVHFKTLPSSGGSWSRKIAVVSCQSNFNSPLTTELAWQDVLDWGPDDVWHLGDFGYWGGTIPGDASYKRDLAHYKTSLSNQDTMRHAIQSAGLNAITISDHELSDNGDPPGGIHNSPQAIRELVAFQKLFPVRHYGDTRRPRRGRYYAYDIGSTVRVIVTDFRSPDRSNVTAPDGPNKTMFGGVQLSWIFDQLDATKVNLLINETSWLADPNNEPGGPRTDKPWTYYHEQLKIAEFIESGGYRVAWIGGDRHYVGYLRGADDGSGVYNTRGGFPCYISSGMSKNQLPLAPGELMNWQFGAGHDLDKWVCGYMRLTLSYDASSGQVTLKGLGRAVLDTSKPKSQWQIEDIPGGTALDSWHLA
jgi:hypothetical protein